MLRPFNLFRGYALIAGLLLLSQCVQAQTAQITGQVVDPSNATVPSATVDVTDPQIGIKREVQTNSDGYFMVPLLPRGRYEVRIQKGGFKSISHPGITLDEGQVLRLDFALAVGDTQQTVEVTGAAPVLDTVTSNVSSVITSNKILQLPLMNRNVTELTELVPTVVPLGGASFHGLPVSSASQGQMSIGGGAPASNSYLIDGIAADNVATGNTNVFLSIDAVEEFRVIARNPSAEYGREGGGVVLMYSKSGTEAFHGSGYEYVRTTDMNANDFFSNRAGLPRPNSNLNQWGATFGGPLIKNKTFFFFNYEGFNLNSATNVTRTVPTLLQLSGNFQGTTDTKGNQVVIYDPLTTAPSGSGYTRTAFPNNQIPAGRISPVAQAMLKYLPPPNQPGIGSTGTNNFFAQGSVPQHKRIYGLKIDHNFSAAQRLAVRFTRDQSYYPNGPNYYGLPVEPLQGQNTLTRYSTAINDTWALKPTFLLELRAGMNKYGISAVAPSAGYAISSLGLPTALQSQLQTQLFPAVTASGITSFGLSYAVPFNQGNYGYTYGGTVTQPRGTHALKYGGEYRVYQLNNNQRTGFPLNLQFDAGFTQGPNPNTSGTNIGSGLASLELGYPNSSTTGTLYATAAYTVKYGALFLQDDWKLTRKLTVNAGLRWDFEGPYTDRHNAMANFDPRATYSVNNVALVGEVTYPGTSGIPRGVRNPSWVHFAPRLGLAYQLFNNTVVHAAYGLYYLPTTGNNVTLGRSGFDQTTAVVNTNAAIEGGFYPTITLSNPFPSGLLPPPGSTGGPASGAGTAVSATGRWLGTGYSQQFSLNIQQQLPEQVKVEVGYAGNQGEHLQAVRQFQYLPFSVAQQYTVAQLQAAVPNPYCAIEASGLICNASTSRSQMLTKYPQFTSVSVLDNWPKSFYNAFTVSVQRRFPQGLDVSSSYTFSKLLDTNIGNGSSAGGLGGSNTVQDWDNLRAERSISTLNLPHRLIAAVLYPLPFFKSGSRLERAVLGGWEPTGILTLQSGNPIGVTTAVGNPPFAGSRPNLIGNPKPQNQSISQWLNSAAFSVAAAETPGTAPRNLSSVRTDAYFDLDVSLLKGFQLTERVNLQFTAEASNVTNTTIFGQPGTGFGSTTFGVVTADVSSPRNIQLGFKAIF